MAARTGRPRPAKTALGAVLQLETTARGARMFEEEGLFLRAETAFGMPENLAGVPGYWEDNTDLRRAAETFGLSVTAAPVFGRRLRSIGAPALGPDGACWLRVVWVAARR